MRIILIVALLAPGLAAAQQDTARPMPYDELMELYLHSLTRRAESVTREMRLQRQLLALRTGVARCSRAHRDSPAFHECVKSLVEDNDLLD